MIYQTKLTDILNPNKFKNCKLRPSVAPNKSFLSIPFYGTQDALGAKRKQLKKKGLGNKPNVFRELLPSKEAKLFKTETFGCKDPVGLQRALWLMISKHFSFRGREESRKLKWEDIKLAQDPETKNEILIWVTNRGTKTKSGGKEMASFRTFNPHIQATRDSQ